MKAIVCGDPHLGLVVGGFDFFEDTVKAFRCIIEATDGVDLFVVLGDLFHDSRPTPRVVAAAIELLDNVDVPTVVIAGNHDICRGLAVSWQDANGKETTQPSRYPLPDALEPLRKNHWRSPKFFPSLPMIEYVGNELFLFGGYVTDAQTQHFSGCSAQKLVCDIFDQARGNQNIRAAFCHLDIQEAKVGSESAVMRGAELSLPVEIAKTFPFPCFDGHIHLSQTIGSNIYLPGSIVPTDFSDVDGSHGYLEVEL